MSKIKQKFRNILENKKNENYTTKEAFKNIVKTTKRIKIIFETFDNL